MAGWVEREERGRTGKGKKGKERKERKGKERKGKGRGGEERRERRGGGQNSGCSILDTSIYTSIQPSSMHPSINLPIHPSPFLPPPIHGSIHHLLNWGSHTDTRRTWRLSCKDPYSTTSGVFGQHGLIQPLTTATATAAAAHAQMWPAGLTSFLFSFNCIFGGESKGNSPRR
ncbi:hypothetical protein D4764_01G0018550 [Takifugu flavidus]|uniref:Uncharacterized protein n=1 Tax=Takifugu flavidus TaxID=433684 RepID=A0A5C6PU43_9TELE|nr:hypothetical protein D4764_01G0018550 [Takifugu flavidus]